MRLTIGELGVLFLIAFGVFYWLGIFATTRAVLAFLGALIVGTAGFVGRILTDVMTWLQATFGTVTAWAFGTALTLGLFFILGAIFVHDLHPRHAAGKRTGWVALALGALLAVGVVGIPALSGLHAAIIQFLANAQAALNSA